MTRERFDHEMTRMIGLRFPPADLQTHWEGLRDLPEDVLTRAITRAIKTRTEFPTPVELRTDADALGPPTLPQEPDRGVDLPEPVVIGTLPTGAPVRATRHWTYYCDVCNDLGIRSFWCGDEPSPRYPWMLVSKCGTANCRKVQYGHEWVQACPCAETNPAVIRRKEQNRQYAEKRMKGAA